MKKYLSALGAASVLLLPAVAGAEGFGLNEWSAEGVAMSGARMFANNDAANIAYNPAAIVKVENSALKYSVTYLSPSCNYDLFDANGARIENEPTQNRIHPAWAPGTYYVKKFGAKDWFGVGAFSRFAMISEFERTSIAGNNAVLSKLNGLSLTPVYAHKFNDKLSAAVGAEINYVGLTMERNAIVNPQLPRAATALKGDSYALGWNAGVNYAFDEKNEAAITYRSRMKHSMDADFIAYTVLGKKTFSARGEVTLPDVWSLGYGHKFNDKTRVELNATHTNWSTYDALDIDIKGIGVVENPKNWKDGWRYAIGVEHKLSDKYSLMAGLAYDQASIPQYPAVGGDFMVPTGDRRTYSVGVQYHDKKQTLGLALAHIDLGDLSLPGGAHDGFERAHAYNSKVKVFSVAYQRSI